MSNIETSKQDLINSLKERVEDGIIERANADLLIKLIEKADSLTEAINVAELGTTYRRTGFHFDKRLEKMGDTIKYLKKNETLSFSDACSTPPTTHKLIIGDNYDALQNLLIEYRGKIDVIYIDPPYGKDDMGEFADTNYDNSITRDNLLSMLYPRLILAKQLLSAEGTIFCSIDDRNLSYVTDLFSEIFTEKRQIFVAPRQTKKGGKTTTTIQKNHDYILCYTMSDSIIFSQQEKDLSGYTYIDEYESDRGPYKLSQTLDYDSLSYSPSLDYPLEIDGITYFPGGDQSAYERRKAGQHAAYDWAWRWSKDLVKFGLDNGFVVIKDTGRIYTKTYLNAKIIKGSDGTYKVEDKSSSKPFTTLSFLENDFSNDNGKKELDKVFGDSKKVFKNPKPSALIESLINMVCLNTSAVVLDFFAGSGTTGHSVLTLNSKDSGNRQFILCTNNEITSLNPNGIAYDATSKRLKRIMTGSCYDGTSDFDWIKNNEPFGGSLDVYDISTVASFDQGEGKSPFDVIDETSYGLPLFERKEEKIKWVCENFDHTQKYLEDR